MGLLDRIRNRPINFADGHSIGRVPSGGGKDIGVVGESLIGGFGDTEARTDRLTVKDYVQMRQSDGTVSSLYNVLTLPILAANRSIQPDENDKNEEQADFIRQVLFSPPHKGGMEIPMQIILADMLRAVTGQ